MKILEIRNLQKGFRSDFYKPVQKVLKNITFSINQGQFVGFIGPNGAGKTTSLKCALEFIFPDSGEILFFNEKLASKHRQKIGFLPERPFFQEFLTGLEFLKLHWTLAGKDRRTFNQHANDVLKQVKLDHAKNKKLKDYSKGMLQRVGIAQALITDPEFLIFDEPMSGLDPDGRILIKQILKSLKLKQKTVLMSSHLLEDVEELCDHIIIVHAGEIVYTGALTEFKQNFATLEEAYSQFKIDFTGGLNL